MATYIAITPARDEEALLPGLIESMRMQTVAPSRWIVIDDGSTDNSLEVISDLCRHHDCIRVIQHDVNRGPYVAVRAGLAAARGELDVLQAP